MRRRWLYGLVWLTLAAALTGACAAQESLGDVARRIRAGKEDGTPSATEKTGTKRGPAPASNDVNAAMTLLSERDETAYATRVKTQLEQEHFKVLDDAAAADRLGKTRFPGGGWRLYTFYSAVESPREKAPATESEWADALDRLKRWAVQRPESVTARVALAHAYLNYAWQARGNGPDASVTPEGKRLFNERIKLAEDELLGVHPNCPEWYYVMLQLGRAKGWEAADLTDLVQKAAAFEPEFYYSYQEAALGLMPQWRGKEGDVEKFTEASANAVGGKGGDVLYWQITQSIMSNRELGNIPQHLSWSRAMLGYQALVAQYGVTPVRQNQLALMAARFGDYMVADDTLTQIGDHWDAATWGTREYFDKIRTWAHNTAVPFRNMIEAYKAVNANVATPEGQKYDSLIAREFSARYARAVNDCSAAASGPAPTMLILRVSAKGAVQQMMVVPETASDACLRPKLEKAAFSPPPRPEYWVRVSLPTKP